MRSATGAKLLFAGVYAGAGHQTARILRAGDVRVTVADFASPVILLRNVVRYVCKAPSRSQSSRSCVTLGSSRTEFR